MHNRHRHERSSEARWSGFLAGAVVGAGIALLLASQRGAWLCGIFMENFNRPNEDLLERAEKAFDKGEEVVRDTGLSTKDFVQESGGTVRDADRSVKTFVKQSQEFVREPGRSAL